VTLDGLQGALAAAGFNLTGALPVEEYDARVPEAWRSERVAPGCRAALVVGNGGRTLWPIFRGSPEARLRRDPLDRYTARVLREVGARCDPPARWALYNERRDERFLPLVGLAERAGLGSPGRVGLLLHPEYGPWISIRGVLWVELQVPFREPEPFDPCSGCPAPCVGACRGGAVGSEGLDGIACFRTKVTQRACRRACDARSACVVSPEHAFGPEQTAHHTRIHWRPATLRHAARVLLARR
jgi:hypothetical protein